MRLALPAGWKSLLEKYKYLLAVVLIGIVLLLPTGTGKPQQQTQPDTQQSFDLAAMEDRLGKALSEISGAGRVTVVLTVKEDGRQILAQDVRDDERQHSRTTVVVSRGGGVEQTVCVQQLSPTFQGALAVCSGGGDPEVRLQLTQAIRALTGLSADKISVCQGK